MLWCSFFLLNLVSSLVFTVKNPVYAAFWLIVTFVVTSVIIWLLNAPFFTLIYIIVYVGAIAVLFLFVIMMLEIKANNLQRLYDFNTFGVFFIYLLFSLCPLLLSFLLSLMLPFTGLFSFEERFNESFDLITELAVFGQLLFNTYTFCILISGLVLLIALIGAVVLTLNFNSQKRKSSLRQLSRTDTFISLFK